MIYSHNQKAKREDLGECREVLTGGLEGLVSDTKSNIVQDQFGQLEYECIS